MAVKSEKAPFDSQSDVAALVYAPGDDPDRLLEDFTSGLRSLGFKVVGAMERRNADQAGHPLAPDLVIVPSGRSMSFARTPLSDGDSSFPPALSAAEGQLLAAVAARPDVLVINRFGWSERSGGGLLSVLSEAVVLDVPVLLAVPKALFGDWIKVSAGLAVKLACRSHSLDAWWRSVSRTPNVDRLGATFCELK